MPLSQAAELVRNTLRYSQVRGIDFQIPIRAGHLRVQSSNFEEVARVIEEERILVRTYLGASVAEQPNARYQSVDDDNPGARSRSGGGTRPWDHDTIYIPTRANAGAYTAEDRALIVHEGLHAWCDLHNLNMKLKIEEAASYIVQVIFGKRLTNTTGQLGSSTGMGLARVVYEADRIVIAHDLVSEHTSPVALSCQYDESGANHGGDLGPLLNALGTIPEYRRSQTNHDGITRARPRPPAQRQRPCQWHWYDPRTW